MQRLLITGAAGRIGSAMRARLGHLAATLRLSDIEDLGPAGAGEEVVRCDLSDAAAVASLVEGCDGIVHLGGIPKEDTWARIRSANIDGTFNIYEGARKHGKPRIVFASSNHVTGFYKPAERLDANSPIKPDGLYGISKAFGETLAGTYYTKFGIETASVRIGSFHPVPRNRRMLSTWLSEDDFVSLIERAFAVPHLGCPIIYGVSANRDTWWDNHLVDHLGWRPKDSSETFRREVEAGSEPIDPDSPEARFQGGRFAAMGICED